MDGKGVPHSSVPEEVPGWGPLIENQRGAMKVSRGPIEVDGEIHDLLTTAPAGRVTDWLVSFREPSGVTHKSGGRGFTTRAVRAATTPPAVHQRPDSVPTLRTVDVLTLILTGNEDVIPLSEAELMKAHIPRATLTVMRKAGHYAVFEQPQEALRILRQFLDAA